MDTTVGEAATPAEVEVVEGGSAPMEVDDVRDMNDPMFMRLSQEEVLNKKREFTYPPAYCEVPAALRTTVNELLDSYIMGVETEYKDVTMKKTQGRADKGGPKKTIKIHFCG